MACAVRNRITGVLYVLDEPSIGLHPFSLVGLTDVMHDLVADGNSVILMDHDTQVLREDDWIIEIGLEATINGAALPAQIRAIKAEGIAHVKLIDATPIGISVRSTVATYAGVHDDLRKLYVKSADAAFEAGQ